MIDSQKLRMIERLAEILEEYLMDNEEVYAECTLKFLKQNGEAQEKVLRWIHPDLEAEMPRQEAVSIGELLKTAPEGTSMAGSCYWNRANEIITNRTKKGRL